MKSTNLAFVSFLIFAICSSVTAKLPYWPSSQSYYSKTHQYFKTFTSNVDVEDCSDETFIFRLDELKITPEVIKPESEVTIEATGYLKEDVTEGAYADVVVKLGLVKLLTKRFDICEELRKDNNELQCPFKEGKFTMRQTVTLPKEIPPAKFLVQAMAYSVDDLDLACFKVRANFMHRRPSRVFDSETDWSQF